MGSLWERAKLYLGVIFLQFGYAGMSIISKHALNKGMSQHVLVVYRHAIATLVIAPFALIFDRYINFLIKLISISLYDNYIFLNNLCFCFTGKSGQR